MTNKSIASPEIRSMYAHELWTLHRANSRMKKSWGDPWMSGIKLGLETSFRRMQRMANTGMIDPSRISPSKIYANAAR